MTRLTSCDLSHCSSPRLSILNMSYNRLKTFDFQVNLQNLQYISLSIIFAYIDNNLLT
jgi:hypothetical protein